MSVKATELRKGSVIVQQGGELYVITEYVHRTPGNLRAFIQVKLKSLSSGQTQTARWSSGDTFEAAYLDRRRCEYLYREPAGNYVFMDAESYEQFPLGEDLVGEVMGYVKENTSVDVTFHDKTPIGVDLPASVTLEVREAEPAVKGNTATNVKKDAVLETGLKVKVPLHISPGDRVRINTSNGDFLGREND